MISLTFALQEKPDGTVAIELGLAEAAPTARERRFAEALSEATREFFLTLARQEAAGVLIEKPGVAALARAVAAEHLRKKQ